MGSSTHYDRHSHADQHHLHEAPHLNHVSAGKPFQWLARGWEDLIAHPSASLAYGAMASVLGIVILGYYSLHPFIVAVSMAGFMLLAPIMAAGLSELSRQRDLHGKTDFETSLKTLKAHKTPLLQYGAILFGISTFWFALSAYLLYESFGSVGPSLSGVLMGDVFVKIPALQMIAYAGIAVVLSMVVFVMSVVTVPMIIDRESDVRTAISTSISASLNADKAALLVWGVLCLLLVTLGFATYLVGMVIIFPLLGHATWYAYRDLVEEEEELDEQ